MSALLKFSRPDFGRGVEDAMTLSPLRKAIRELVVSHNVVHSNAKKPSVKDIVANDQKTTKRSK